MRKIAVLLVLISGTAFGQGVFYSSNATQTASNVPPGSAGPIYTVPNALITVCSYPAVGDPCTNKVDIFTDQDLAPEHKITQPLQADSLGRYQFWVAPGIYSQSIQTQSGVSKGTYPLSLDSPPGPQGPAGIGCGAGFSQCIVETPTTDQTITQPSGTTFAVSSLNSVMNPLLFPGSDLGAKINAAFATCPNRQSGPLGETGCTVKIPVGNYTYATTIVMLPGDTLEGSGAANTSLTYTGSGDAIYWHSDTFNNLSYSGEIKNLTVVGTANAANGIHVAGLGAPIFTNLTVGLFTGPTADGILLEDITDLAGKQTWMERIQMHNVNLGTSGLDNTTNLEFRNNGGSGSFDYSDIHITMNVHCNGTGVLIGSGTDLLGVQLFIQGNVNGGCSSPDTGEALSVKGFLRYASGFIRLEGGSTPNVFHVYNGGQVIYNGTISSWTNGKDIPPVIDAGGFWQANPFMDFGYPNGNPDGLSPFVPFVQRASKNITADGTITLTAGNNITGIYDLIWPSDNGRFQDLLFSVSCNPFGNKTCDITTLSNQSITNPPVFSNLRVTAGSSQPIPHLLVDISNRNVLPQNIYFTQLAGSPTILFPTDNADSTVISKEGLTVRSTGSSASDGLTWGNSSHSIIPSSDNVIWTNDGAPAAGACTPTNSINVLYNGQSIRIPTC